LPAEAAGEPSAELMKEPEIATLRLSPEDVKPYLEQVNDIKQSPLVLNRFQQEERVNAIAQRAIAELLTGDRAIRLRRRLEARAHYMMRAGRRQPAGWAAAAAARMRDGAELARLPFFQAFIRAHPGQATAAHSGP